MNKKFHKLFTGVTLAGLTVGLAIVPMAAQAGEIPSNGVFAWGSNASGSLGANKTGLLQVPELVGKDLVDITSVATSTNHTLFLNKNGHIYASGDNSTGQLGTGNLTSSNKPVPVELPLRFGVPDYATQIWVGDNVSFMRGSFGDLYSWGSNNLGRTGLGLTSGNTLKPTKVNNVLFLDNNKKNLSVSDTSVGVIHTTPDNQVILKVWGDNSKKTLSVNPAITSTIISKPSKSLIDDPDEERTVDEEKCSIIDGSEECDYVTRNKTYDEFIGLSPDLFQAGNYFNVVATDTGSILTWGINTKGQLGQNLPLNKVLTKPTASSALQLEDGATATSIASGDEHTIILGSDGLIYAFGDNTDSETSPYYKQGTPPTHLNVLQRVSIQKEISDNSSWSEVFASNNSSYATTNGNDVYGWGDNSSKELAHSDKTVKVPTRISFPYESEVASFSAGGDNAIAITDYIYEYKDLSITNTNEALNNGSTHTKYSYDLNSVDGYPGKAHRWTIYGLPKGLTYNANTGLITGVPTEVGEFDIEANVTDNVEDIMQNYTLKISKSTPVVNVSYSNLTPGKSRATIKVNKDSYLATGSVSLNINGVLTNANLFNGQAIIDFNGTAGSTVSASVKYNGSASLNTANSTTSKVIVTNKKTPSKVSAIYSSPAPGQLKAVITAKDGTANATGSVSFKYGSTVKTANLVNGVATITVQANAATKYTVSSTYNGSTTLGSKAANSSSITTMAKRASTLTSTYSTPQPGELKAVISVKDGKNAATGSVTLKYGSVSKTVNLNKGAATIHIKGLVAGKKYAVSTIYNGSTVSHGKTLAAKNVTLKAKHSSTPTVKYAVSGKKATATVTVATKSGLVPTGRVDIYNGKTRVGYANISKNKATIKITFKKAGTYKLQAKYIGSGTYNAKNSSIASVKIK